MYPVSKAEEAPAPATATGVPMSVPATYYQAPPPGGATAAFAVQAQAPIAAWSTGLCDCFDDCSNCKRSLPPFFLRVPVLLAAG
jgi:hypothetical protein